MILAAPLLLVAGGVVAYAKLTEAAPIGAVPDVVDRDVFAAAAILQDAGFEVDSRRRRQPASRRHDPRRSARSTAKKLEEGSTVMLTISKTDADGARRDARWTSTTRRWRCAQRGFTNFTVTPDYRDDVDAGTVMSTNPGGEPAGAQDATRSSSWSPPTRT